MGSGISITNKQAIEIVRREIVNTFRESERLKRIVDDYGYLLPESFEDEAKYIKHIRLLETIETNNFSKSNRFIL